MTIQESSRASRGIRAAAERFSAPLGAVGSLATVAMMIAISVDVISRNVAGRSVPGLFELSETLLVTAVFFGLSYAGAANAHVSVDLITSHLPLGVARRVAGAMWLLGSGMTAWFIYATAKRAIDSTMSSEISVGIVDWPIWPTRWIIVAGYAAFVLVALANAYLGLRGERLLGEDDDDETLTIAPETKEETS